MNTFRLIAMSLMVSISVSAMAEPLGTAFTYQ